jgi:hypothetical protein
MVGLELAIAGVLMVQDMIAKHAVILYRVTGYSKKENMNLQRQSMKRYLSFFLRHVFLFIAEVSEFLDGAIVGAFAS